MSLDKISDSNEISIDIKSQEKNTLYPEPSIPEPYLDLLQLSERFPESNINLNDIEKSLGLRDDIVLAKQLKNGKNVLTPPKSVPTIVLFLRQFLNLFMILLLVASLLSLIAYFIDREQSINLYLSIVLFAIVIISCTMSFFQEKSSQNVMNSFKNMLPLQCTVIRGEEGIISSIAAEELVRGDLVWIRNGDKVPADIRLIVCNNLKVECSSLTGESEPIQCVAKSYEYIEEYYNILECKNMVFNGSLCFDGSGVGIVLSTGDTTMLGKLAALTSSTIVPVTNMEKEINSFVRFIAILALSMATLFFSIGAIRKNGKDIISTFISGFLVIIVANVPQGLPATVTSLLTITAQKMFQRNILVKRLDCIETLGSTTLIATDKTGTLTKNQMTLTDIWHGMENENTFIQNGSVQNHQEHINNHLNEDNNNYLYGHLSLPLLYRAGCLCNRAGIKGSGSPTNKVKFEEFIKNKSDTNINIDKIYTGNPSDIAILRFCDLQYPIEITRYTYPILYEIPFNSTNKWQLVIVPFKTSESNAISMDIQENQSIQLNISNVKDPNEMENYQVFMKGAPEVILKKCTTFLSKSGTEELITDNFLLSFHHAYENFGNEGKRVIAIAGKNFKSNKNTSFLYDSNYTNFPIDQLCFIGLTAIMDPPRDDVPDAIHSCKAAGIKVFMVTGDHPLTAKAIAKQIQLLHPKGKILDITDTVPSDIKEWKDYDSAVVHGRHIDHFTLNEWNELLSKQAIVFARTTPQHKLKIVQECQNRKETVAVTGDGVNDSPALKQADVGVAMGKNGSDVARDAADIVLMDDNFSSIVDGIRQGRLIFDNLKKTIAYTLTHLGPEIFPVLLTLSLGLPPGLTSIQILSVDLLTELAPAISLAYELPEKDIMNRPPRNPKSDKLVSVALLVYAYLIAGIIESIGTFLSYCIVFWSYDISLSDIYLSDDLYWKEHSKPFCIKNNTICYNHKEQINILNLACSAWYITLVFSQVFHIWMCKTRRISIFRHSMANITMIYGVIIELLIMIILVYIPQIQKFMGSASVNGYPWIMGTIVGFILFIYNEINKKWIRSHTFNKWTKFSAW